MAKDARVSADTVRLRRLAARVAQRILQERKDVLAIGIAGSVARGEAGPGSDLDMDVIVRRGPREHVGVVLDGTLLSLSFKTRRDFERHFTEASANLSHRHGGLHAEVLYDPGGLFASVRAKVARLPEQVYRDSARDVLARMYEYLGKMRNARRRADHRNVVYGAWIVGLQAINLVGLLNRRPYTSENTMWSEWRAFPALPPGFADLVDVACGFRRVSDTTLLTATEALWSTCQRWAGRRGVRLRAIRNLRSLRIPGRKTT